VVAVALVVLYLVWGSTYLAMRVAIEGLPPLGMAGVRYVLAGTILLAVLRLRGAPMPNARQWRLSLPLGALFFLCGNGFVVLAEKTIDSSIAAVVCATTPLIAAGIGAMTGERPSRAETIGTLLGLSGVALLALGSPLATSGPRGLIVLLAPIGWAIGSMLARRTGATGFGSAAAQMIAGGGWMLLASVIAGEEVPGAVSFRVAFAWTYLVAFGSLVGFSAYVYLLGRTRPAVAMSYAYVNPIIAVILGAALGGEHIAPSTVVATALIAAGVMCAVMLKARALRVEPVSCSTSTSKPATSGPT
jgi:drug/metabolite transporter (DMT)-like permease